MKGRFIFLVFLIGCTESVIDHYPIGNLPARWNSSDLRRMGGVTVSISQDFSDESDIFQYDEKGLHVFEQMARHWDDVVPWIVFFYYPFEIVDNVDYLSDRDYRDDQMGIYNSISWQISDKTDILAATNYFGIPRGNYLQLTHVDIIVNSKYHRFSFDPFDWNKYYLPCIILHELGHLLGLSHSEEEGSVMYQSTTVNNSQCDLSKFDIKDIQQKYSKTNSNSGLIPVSLAQSERHGEIFYGTHELKIDGSCTHKKPGNFRSPASN